MGAISRSRHPGRCRHLLLGLVASLLVGGLLPIAEGNPAEAAFAEPWEELIRTFSFRSAAASHVGQYASIGNWKPATDDAVGHWGSNKVRVGLKGDHSRNKLSLEYGLFKVDPSEFKLLGANGRWVKGKAYEGDAIDGKRLVASAKKWDKGWSFELERPNPAILSWQVVAELRSNGIATDAPVCLIARNAGGKAAGLLRMDAATGYVYADKGGKCGADTTSLFLSDAAQAGSDIQKVTKAVTVDPISRVRFTAPDYPDRSLTRSDYTDVKTDMLEYFDDFETFLNELRNEVNGQLTNATFGALPTSFVVPGEEPEPLDWGDFIVGAVESAIDFIPGSEGVSFLIDAAYSLVKIGIANAANADLQAPRVVEETTNLIITQRGQLYRAYRREFNDAERQREALEASILAGCATWNTCTDDRMFVAWNDPGHLEPIWPTEDAAQRERLLLGYVYEIYRAFFESRGVVWHVHHETAGSPPTNPQFLAYYGRQADLQTTEGDFGRVPRRLAVTHSPFDDMGAWELGWANNDQVATPVDDGIVERLFARINRGSPDKGGLGLSRQEVACEWISRSYGAWPPCHIPFYDAATDAVINPYDIHGMPLTAVMWVPTELEIRKGRDLHDPDITSAMIGRPEYGRCGAELTSVGDGELVDLYVANLSVADIEIRYVKPSGAEKAVATASRDQALVDGLAGT